MTGIVLGQSTLVGKRMTLGYRGPRVARHGDSCRRAAATRPRVSLVRLRAAAERLAAYDVLDDPPRTEGYASGHILPRTSTSTSPAIQGSPPDSLRAAPPGQSSPRPLSQRAWELVRHLGRASPPLFLARIFPSPSGRRVGGEGVHPGPGLLLASTDCPPGHIEPLSQASDRRRCRGPPAPVRTERSLVARLVYAVADPDLPERVSLVGDPIHKGDDALARGSNLVVDVGMVAAGISPALPPRSASTFISRSADGVAQLSEQYGITRPAAGILALADRLDGAVVAISEYTDSAACALDLRAAGPRPPGCVIGMPVGFVAAEESSTCWRPGLQASSYAARGAGRRSPPRR